MASVYKTPGVYVEEIPKLPPSVAQVETAIPAFVGYTQIAEKDGEDLTNKPTRISSLVEFNAYFGGANEPTQIEVEVDATNNYAVTGVYVANDQRYVMYDCIRLFYDNGGGDCFIVSVGRTGTDSPDKDQLKAGIQALEKEDAPTILLFPDAVMMSVSTRTVDVDDDAGLYELQQTALSQCAKLQDRVAVLDIKENIAPGFDQAIQNFRDSVGINNLKYGAAYTPWIRHTYTPDIDFTAFRDHVYVGATQTDLNTVTASPELNALVDSTNAAISQVEAVQTVLDTIRGASATITDAFFALKLAVDAASDDTGAETALEALLGFCNTALLAFLNLEPALTTTFGNDLSSYALSDNLWKGAAEGFVALSKHTDKTTVAGNDVVNEGTYSGINNHAWFGGQVTGDIADPGNVFSGTNADIGRQLGAVALTHFTQLTDFADTILEAANNYASAAQNALYERHSIIGNIVRHIQKELSTVPPSGAIAGVYAQVDNARGVWKAPANVSLNSVSGPSETISHDEQANLNVDTLAGKSINAIRSFTGKGTLVWGARTLAGNDNEWRYVSVRRFFNMVEESSKKSTEPFVFEPNDANTWVKVQAMLENYLTNLWRQGALQGAKPEHAFYVAVGLGKTMTAVDILEGRMIVEIGMAVVRPAEFIILEFSHKMAES